MRAQGCQMSAEFFEFKIILFENGAKRKQVPSWFVSVWNLAF